MTLLADLKALDQKLDKYDYPRNAMPDQDACCRLRVHMDVEHALLQPSQWTAFQTSLRELLPLLQLGESAWLPEARHLLADSASMQLHSVLVVCLE